MEEARKDGIVENIGSSGNYRCKLCKTECSVIPMMAHLKGEKHKNNLIFKILQEPTRKWHSEVTSGIDIPEHIRMAARSKKIDVDVQQKQIHCCICVPRTTVNGLTTLIQHFESHSIQTDGTHAPRSDLSFVAASPAAANGPRNTGIMQGQLETNLRLGIIINENGSQTQFRCTICDTPISGSEQAEAHLAGSQHRKKLTANNTSVNSDLPQAPLAGPSISASHDRELLRKAIQNEELQINGNIYTCNICQAFKMTEAPALQHINGKTHKKLTTVPVVPSFVYDSKGKKKKTPSVSASEAGEQELQNSLKRGELRKEGNEYECTLCIVTLNGDKPALQHVRGESHEKRLRFKQVAPSPDPVTAVDNKKESEIEIYTIRSQPRGIVLVLNNIFRRRPVPTYREGAQHDSQNIQIVFEKLGYKVYIHVDKTKDETIAIIKELSESKELFQVDSLIVFILSHGSDGFNIQTYDEKKTSIHLNEISYSFKDSKCPALKGKPKLFFCNFCRGKDTEEPLQTDNYAEDGGVCTDAPKDMITFYASIDGFVAIRNPNKGTIFVSSLCETLKKYPTANLSDFEIRFYNTTEANEGNTPEVQKFGFRKHFYFAEAI